MSVGISHICETHTVNGLLRFWAPALVRRESSGEWHRQSHRKREEIDVARGTCKIGGLVRYSRGDTIRRPPISANPSVLKGAGRCRCIWIAMKRAKSRP